MQLKPYSKKDIRIYVQNLLTGKIKKLEFYLNFTLEASREIKKTAKFDSFREEIQEEIYHLDKQMYSLKTMQRKMQQVLNSETKTAQLGSLVITNKARFYISISLGEFFFEEDRFYAISEESPMANILHGKKVGDSFVLNTISQEILQIF
jgi:transcription elongation factor GreA